MRKKILASGIEERMKINEKKLTKINNSNNGGISREYEG